VVACEQHVAGTYALDTGQVRSVGQFDAVVHANAQEPSHHVARSADVRRTHQLLGQRLQQCHRALQEI